MLLNSVGDYVNMTPNHYTTVSLSHHLPPINSHHNIPQQSSLDARRSRDRGFLQQLLNPKLIDEFKVPLKLKVQLRQYQQVNEIDCWLGDVG